MKKVLMILFLFTQLPCFGQSYNALVSKAATYYKSKDYQSAAITYSQAFSFMGGKAFQGDRYNAGCCWALAGNADSAFYHLERLVTKGGFADYDHIVADLDLVSLHNDKRWVPMLEMVRQNQQKTTMGKNAELSTLLDTIYDHDQKFRKLTNDTSKIYGGTAEGLKNLWKTIHFNDSINQIKVEAILDKYGWLGEDMVGKIGNSALFLVIQHADLKTQEKYLPMMREAVKNGIARAGSLALLEDRVAMRQGKKQIYGSQINCSNGSCNIYPIEDEINVNIRRALVGLEPLEEYVKNWGMVYKLPEK